MKIAIIGGDGTGPEVAAEGVKVLKSVAKLEGFADKLELTDLDWGGDRYLKTGEALPADELDQLRKFDAILLGAVGHPDVAPGILERKLLLDVRFGLDQYINLRPVKLFPGVETPLNIRLLILPLLQVTVPMAELMKEQLSEIGVEIEIEQKDLATFVQEYAIDFTAMLTVTWYAGFSDPYLFLLNFRSTATGPFVGATETTQIDALLDQVSSQTDLEERKATFGQIEQLMAEEGYFQFLATRNNFVAWRNDLLTGVELLAADGFGLPYWHVIENISIAG